MRKIIYLFIAAAFLFNGSKAFTQTSVVMKAIDNGVSLNGGSTVAKHLNEIDLYSYSQGESNCADCHLPSLSSFNVMIKLSPATMAFKKLLLNGTKLTTVDVAYIKPGTTPFTYYKVRMENVTVESVQESGSSDAPFFSVSLIPERIAWQQINQTAAGGIGQKVSYGWDLTSNTEWIFNF